MLALLAEILGYVVGLVTRVAAIQATLTVIQNLLGQQGNQAVEHTPYNIEAAALNVEAAASNATTGFIHAYSQARSDTGDILAAIAAITPSPPAPPPSPTDIASAVWQATDPNSVPSRVYGDEIWEAHLFASTFNVSALQRSPLAPFFAFNINDNVSGVTSLRYFPEPDWTDIRASDTRLSWLTRTEPDLTWDDGGTAGCPHGYYAGGPFPVADWYFLMTEAQFNALKLAPASNTAPVWPGLASVTLGTPVALADQLVVTGPLHGVLLTGLSGGGRLSEIMVGGISYKFRMGEVTFQTDNGQAEPWQYLGFADAIYCPRQMTRADSALFRVLGGVTGTVTPFTII